MFFIPHPSVVNQSGPTEDLLITVDIHLRTNSYVFYPVLSNADHCGPMRTNDNLLITVLGKPMRFLRNFLRKLKITTFFNMDITGPGFVITSSSSHDGPHFLSQLVIHRKVKFFKEEKTRDIQKWGNEENIQKRISSLFIPDIHFTVFNFLTFPFCLALT